MDQAVAMELSDDDLVKEAVEARDLASEYAEKFEQLKHEARRRMDERKSENIKTKSGTMFFGKEQMKADYPKDMKDELHKFLRENGFGGLIQEGVHHSTLNSFVAEQDGTVDWPIWLNIHKVRPINVRRG